MSKKLTRILCGVMVAVLIIGFLAMLAPTKAADTLTYRYGANNVIYNWGARGYDATALSPNAVAFYSENNVTYDQLAALSGSATTSSVPSSALFQRLRTLMASNHDDETSYNDTRTLFRYTDCMNNGYDPELGDQISSFYSGTAIGPAWDSGSTWNREHTWPNSKGDANGNGENDIIMLRPTHKNENGSRSNKAYGESGSYYDPNSVSNGLYNLRGDVARIVLYVYTRWQNTSSSDAVLFGSSGVMESKEVLLKWMAEDPVDTWEMGRNDSVESITGTRNVFVDYPELAFTLFGEAIPADMATPSNGQGTGTGPVVPPVLAVPDIVTAPQVGTAYKLFMNQVIENKVLFFNGQTESEEITYRLATTVNAEEATEVFLEEALGGYHLYFMNGETKTYIRIFERTKSDGSLGGSLELVTEKPAEVLTYDSTVNTLVYTTEGGNGYYLGTYKNYQTFSVSSTSYITGENAGNVDASQFPARFADASFVGGGEGTTTPTNPTTPTTPAPSVPAGTTDLDIVMEAYSLAPGAEMNRAVTLTGTIKKVNTAYDANYNNVTVTMYVPSGEDMPIKCYRLAGEGADQIGVGDVITVTGTIVNFVHSSGDTEVEFKQGCQLVSWQDNGSTEPSIPSNPGTDSFTKINSLSELTSGQYVMIVNTGYAPGVVDGTWITAVQPVVSGNTVTNAQGGIWTLTVYGSSASIKDANGVFVSPKGGNNNGLGTNDYNWDVVFEDGGFKFVGTGNDTVTLASNTSSEFGNKFRGYKTTTVENYADSYPSVFTLYKAGGTVVDPSEPTEPTDPTDPTEPSTPTEPPVNNITMEIVTAPAVGTPYKMGMDFEGNIHFINGNIGNKDYYLATSTDIIDAVDVYLEEVAGGYLLYFIADGTKTYIHVSEYQDGEAGMGKGTLKLTTERPTDYFTFDTATNILVFTAADGENSYYMGTYFSSTANKIYDTVSTSNTSYITGENASKIGESQFPLYLYTEVQGEGPETGKNGWVYENGAWYYYENGQMLANRWFCEYGNWYWFQADGVMAANQWILDGGKWYWLEAEGQMAVNCWKLDSIGWVHLGKDGAMQTNTWCMDGQGWCYVGEDGYAVTNCWKQDSIGWIYLNVNGSMTKDQWLYDGGKWYYLDGNGYMVTNQWMQDSIGWVHLGADGAMQTNIWCMDSQGWCYVGADGYAVTNCWKQDSIGWIYLNSNGSMTKNQWLYDGGNWYYLDANGYMMENQWLFDGANWFYLGAGGCMLSNTSLTQYGVTYYFNASGICTNP